MPSHEPLLWLNGSLLPKEEARVSPSDHGFTVGDGAFETLRAYEGRLFAPSLHWNRLVRSCESLGILPPGREEFQSAMETTLNASGLREARVRFTVSSGDGPQGSGRNGSHRTMCCMVAPAPAYHESERVVTVPWTRNDRGALTGVKSVSYAENVIALVHAKRQGAGEAIFGNTKGELCEGTGTNVFIVDGDTLRTPPLSSGCLAGVTRGLVIEVCRTHDIPVNDDPIPLSALSSAQEAFLTSSTREVHPIAQVDATPLSQIAGPLTRKVAGLFRDLISTERDPLPLLR
jgi:branched-chain amino acid aminotransferase